MFETFKSLLLESCPGPRFPFMSEQVKGGDNVGEVWDEFSVKVCKSGERLDSFDQSGGFPFLYGFQLLFIHLDLSLSDDHAQELHARGIKHTFGKFVTIHVLGGVEALVKCAHGEGQHCPWCEFLGHPCRFLATSPSTCLQRCGS